MSLLLCVCVCALVRITTTCIWCGTTCQRISGKKRIGSRNNRKVISKSIDDRMHKRRGKDASKNRRREEELVERRKRRKRNQPLASYVIIRAILLLQLVVECREKFSPSFLSCSFDHPYNHDHPDSVLHSSNK